MNLSHPQPETRRAFFRQLGRLGALGALGLLTGSLVARRRTNESVEGVLGTQYWFFRYNAPEASLDATVNLFPSLTESGRLRSEAQMNARYEIVTDLFFQLSFYGSYDSQPGAGAESKSDYGVTTSLGYSF